MELREQLGAIVSFLSQLARRIEAFDPLWLDGPIQFTLTAPVRAHWHILPGVGTVRVVEGGHPNPKWGIEAPLDAFMKIAENRFAFRDPKALATIRISGDVLSLHRKLNAFLSPDNAARLLEGFRIRQAAAARLKLGSHGEIRTAPEFSEAEIRRAREELRPVIFARGLLNWPVWKWAFADLVERCKSVPFMNISSYRETTLGAFVAQVVRGDAADRAAGLALPQELARDLLRNSFREIQAGEPVMWLGPKGYVTPLHRDGPDILNLQVLGRKHWGLYSPDQAEFLYPAPPVEGYQPAQVNVRQPDLQRHPGFARARCLECIMEPGQILFNPGGWFHEVDALDAAFSVSMPLAYPARTPSTVY